MTTRSTSREGVPDERAAGFVLFRTDGGKRRYLVLRHRDGGHWSFPKGRIEQSERPLEAAVREVEEETGLAGIRPLPGFRSASRYRFERSGRSIEKAVVYYLAEVRAEPVVLSAEHTEARWLDAAAARGTLTYEESQRVLDAAEDYLAQRPSGVGGTR